MRAVALITASLITCCSFVLLSADTTTPAQPKENTATDWSLCLDCHPDYSSGLPALADLRPTGTGPVLRADCSDCHAPSDLTIMTSDWRHPVRPVGEHLPCTECHLAVPHDGQSPPPLPTGDYLVEGCYACHGDVSIERALVSSHGEQPGLSCIGCHPPHEPLQAALTPELLPESVRPILSGGNDWYLSNELCLRCHPVGLMFAVLDRGFVTLNTVNYHERHVLGDVLCIECHAPHGSMRDALIRPQLLTGELLSYYGNIDGGTCNVRCHGISHDDWVYINKVF